MIKPFFNPFTGDIELLPNLTGTAEAAEKVQEEFDLLGPAQVGDLVVPSLIQNDAVEAISSNTYDPEVSVFGVLLEFVAPTRVKILISGKLSGSLYQVSGLTFGKTLFVSASGKLTTTVPPTGIIQKMGIALKSDSVFLLPSLDKVIRT